MRQICCAFVLTILILAVDADNAFGQDEALSHYAKGKLVEISDLISNDQQEKCLPESIKRYGGTVLAVQFTEGAIINNFTLKTPKGNVKIHISPMLYAEKISKQDATALPTLIAKGRRITVDTYRCGDAKKIIMAVYIIAGIHMETLG